MRRTEVKSFALLRSLLLFLVFSNGPIRGTALFDYYDSEFDYEDTFPQEYRNPLWIPEEPGKRKHPEVPPIDLDPEWPSPDVYEQLGIISAVSPVDPSGSTVLVLHRGDRSWDSKTFNLENQYRHSDLGPITDGVVVRLVNGQFAGSFLNNTFYMPHGISVDHQGNVWITDVAMHQIFKFGPNLDGKPLMVLGEAFVPGSDEKHFCQPTHVVVAKNGDFFVSDGYCNSRIMKFNANGNLIKQWGKRTANPLALGPYDLNLPHQLSLDEDQDLLCVADRVDQRVVCYKAGLDQTPNAPGLTGMFQFDLRESLIGVGAVYGVAIAPKENILFALILDGASASVRMFDLESKKILGTIVDVNQGFGYAHTISSCTSSSHPGCLFVCNLNPPARQTRRWRTADERRLWLYRFPQE